MPFSDVSDINYNIFTTGTLNTCVIIITIIDILPVCKNYIFCFNSNIFLNYDKCICNNDY